MMCRFKSYRPYVKQVAFGSPVSRICDRMMLFFFFIFLRYYDD